MTHDQYQVLSQRYRELGDGGGLGSGGIAFDVDSHVSEQGTGKINTD
ncbi:hypothetical protein [Rhodopirellula europaea]|uniref:Uncharacterized protein n=1 Tax=Rhodopirellula europaea 6C TaxID=1263867 RepID=M2A4I7_9BACT|nr:hypothetical protein [Rhodopirellula europaea]EMB14581.1 hypothetical protein RE6C_05003 [Rhodopirellula europaea 6C]